jgi:hypothetical protein
MRAEEFLSTLITVLDKLEKKSTEKAPQPVIININGEEGSAQINTNSNTEPESEEEEVVTDNTGKFIPPLQQNIEILKKNAGIKSAFDQEASNAVIPGP